MKTIVWGVFAFLTICWTALVALSVQLTEWLLGSAGSGQAAAAATAVGEWPVPAWAALWVDPAWLQALQAMWLDLVQWGGQVAPSRGGQDAQAEHRAGAGNRHHREQRHEHQLHRG